MVNLNKSLETAKRWAAIELRRGITPARLALTLALGFAVGCLPVIGIPTLLCAGIALALRLNLPAIQMANYAAMPFQLLLIVPFVRLGGWLFNAGPVRATQLEAMLHTPPIHLLAQLGGLFGHALAAWLMLAAPAVALLTLALTLLLRRIPAMAMAQACD